MNQTVACILLLLSGSATFGKYVYIDRRMNRHEAQEYCRLFHTDLAPISSAYDTRRLQWLVGDVGYFMWIGLEKDSTDREKWMWSGGGRVSTFFWAPNEPNNFPNDDYGAIRYYKWYDSRSSFVIRFFCYDVIVVRERKTWEEALDYCRARHRDLASIASETEMLLIQKELDKNLTTEHVWIGLRFLPGDWLWVDKQPLEYKAWGHEGEPSCPKVNLKCGALQVTGGTQNNTSTGTVQAQNTNNRGNHVYENIVEMNRLSITGRSNAVEGVKVWEARECEERLHFLCY